MQTTIVPNIKQLPRIPHPGEIYLSIDLAMADPGKVWELAKELGFTPELAYLPTSLGIEIHALLHHEQRQLGSLLDTNDFDDRIESLMEAGINPDAIRIVYGKERSLQSKL
ncbi:MAG: hypothetical protein KME17_18670 [Cyanosarcina radialis HA8281-LM2]|jgi:hypothetical protein|nr:hypothetical protein [Cyanosarcina radialis HA8281-LM2]